MAGATIKMNCKTATTGIRELAFALKKGINAELTCECWRNMNCATVLLLSFEKYYFRVGGYVSLTIMITEEGSIQTADIVGSGGGEGISNISWGANASFTNMAIDMLEKYGFEIADR